MKKTKLSFILLLSIAFFQAAVVNRDKPRKGEWDQSFHQGRRIYPNSETGRQAA